MIDTPTLITELRVHLGGLDSTELSDTDALLLLNRAYWELLDRYKFREKETTATFSIDKGTTFFDIPVPFEAIQLLSIEDVNTFQHSTLDRMSKFEYENLLNLNPDESAQAKPKKYLRENAGIRPWPIPDQCYSLTITYWTTLSDLVNTGGNLPGPPQIWGEVILQGAIARGFRKLGDYTRAKAAMDEFERLNTTYELVPSKEAGDTHRAGMNVMGYDDVYNNFNIGRDLKRWT